MTKPLQEPRTGYFNALTSGYFKIARDGRKLFFPWGATSRGYVIPSQPAYEQLHRTIKIFQIVSLVAIVAAVATKFYVAAFVIAGLSVAWFGAWAKYLVRGMLPSDERLSMGGSIGR